MAEESALEQEVCAVKCATSAAAAAEIVAKTEEANGDGEGEQPRIVQVESGLDAACATMRATNAAKVKVHGAVAKAKARPDLSKAKRILSPAGHVWAALQAQGVGKEHIPSIEVLQEAMDIASRSSAAEDEPPEASAAAEEHPEATSAKKGRVDRTSMDLEQESQEEE